MPGVVNEHSGLELDKLVGLVDHTQAELSGLVDTAGLRKCTWEALSEEVLEVGQARAEQLSSKAGRDARRPPRGDA